MGVAGTEVAPGVFADGLFAGVIGALEADHDGVGALGAGRRGDADARMILFMPPPKDMPENIMTVMGAMADAANRR